MPQINISVVDFYSFRLNVYIYDIDLNTHTHSNLPNYTFSTLRSRRNNLSHAFFLNISNMKYVLYRPHNVNIAIWTINACLNPWKKIFQDKIVEACMKQFKIIKFQWYIFKTWGNVYVIASHERKNENESQKKRKSISIIGSVDIEIAKINST